MNLKCLLFGHIPDKLEVIENIIPFTEVHCKRCGSAGHVSQDSVKRYILEQEGKDVFDYNIYGCPSELDVKIGNFTQSKLEVN